MIERPRGSPDLLIATWGIKISSFQKKKSSRKHTCSVTAMLDTLLTVVSVKVVLVMDSVTTEGWEDVSQTLDLSRISTQTRQLVVSIVGGGRLVVAGGRGTHGVVARLSVPQAIAGSVGHIATGAKKP